MLDSTKILAIIRRYAQAFAEGRIEAKAVASMTDDELIAFDEELSETLEAKQQEAEDLAKP